MEYSLLFIVAVNHLLLLLKRNGVETDLKKRTWYGSVITKSKKKERSTIVVRKRNEHFLLSYTVISHSS